MTQRKRGRRGRFGDWESTFWNSTNNLAAGTTQIYMLYGLVPQIQMNNQIGVGSAIIEELDFWLYFTGTALLTAQQSVCAGLAHDTWDANPALGAGPPVGAWGIRGDLTSPIAGNSVATEDDWVWGPEPKVFMMPSNASQTAVCCIGYQVKIRKPIVIHQGQRLAFYLTNSPSSTAAVIATFSERHHVRRIA